jgi:hypothetical protein
MAKKSRHIEIGFVSMVAAAALAGCHSQALYHRDWQQCVDQNNVVVDDRYCDQPHPVAAPLFFYHWLYTPRPYFRGETVFGGFETPRPNMAVARSSSSVSRGGFGSSAHGEGGGE